MKNQKIKIDKSVETYNDKILASAKEPLILTNHLTFLY
jgi:hypothetical protein